MNPLTYLVTSLHGLFKEPVMANVWANSMACHPRATFHVALCCHLVNSLTWFQSHMGAGCSHLTKSMSWSCHNQGVIIPSTILKIVFSIFYFIFVF